MEGSDPHSESHSRAAPPPTSSASAAAAYFKNVCTNGGADRGNAFIAHDNVLGGPPKYGLMPRAEQYSKIFESFRSGKACSIPMLDLPPFDDSAAAFDFVGCSGFVYTEIFGGFDLPDLALSFDELFKRSDGRQASSESDAWTQVGTESLSEESDPSACSGRNQYVLSGDLHQTNDTKFNLSYHKANMATIEDSNVIHVAQLSHVLGNSYMYEGSSLQTEVEERFSSEVADDISLCEDSSGISAETQSKPASIPSHDSGEKNGRPHGINRSPSAISDSDVCLTTEPSHVLQTSSAPPTAADRKNDPVKSMSDSERPKSNALFDVGSLDFLNAELDTSSPGIASAAAIKEAMDRAKVKLESARESTERKNDAVKGKRPVMKNDMNGNGKVRMLFDESILRDNELQPNHESEYSLFKIIGREMQDVSEASQVLPDPWEAEKNSVNGDAKPAQRKITKNQSSPEVANREDNGRGLKDAIQLEDKEEVCTQKGTDGRKRVVSPTDENLIVLNEALGQKEEPGKSGRKEKQQSDVWSKKADKESRKSENDKSEKEGRETKLKEVQKTYHCQKNVEEETMLDCYEKKLKHSIEMEKFEMLEVTIENNRTEKKIDAAHLLASKSMKLERSDNTDKIEDEVAEKEMEMLVQRSESENSQKMYGDSAINEELKMDKVDLYAELKSTEQYSYKGRYLNADSEYSTSSTGSYAVYETKNKVPEMTFECEDLKSSNLAARLNEKNIAPEDVENTGKFRRKEEFERAHLRELELEREKERETELEKRRIRQLEEEREREREKKLKLHLKRLEELRERERETEVDKDCLSKVEEESQGEREKKLEKECLGKLDDEWEQEREREKDRMGVKLKTSAAHERVFTEADEITERAAAEIATAEARQRAMAEARERLEKACAVAREKSLSEKSSTESRLRAERAAVAQATAEARERAIEKAIAERDTFDAPEQVARSASEKFSSPLGDIELRHTSSSSDLWNSDMTDEVEGESAQRGRAKLERHRRTVERVAKALAEKSTRDLIAQKEQAERNRLAESLDADIKRWSNGKEGNLRALLSTLQYILGPDSGWHPIALTEIISSGAVKKAYRKATLCVHPDKLQQRGASTQQKYICEKVFDLLKDSWNGFNSEER